MKRILLFLFLLTTALGLHAKEGARSKVCLNMIVKNEAHVITRCLESVLPLIDCYVIVDTGSEDGTQEVIKKYMDIKNIPGKIYNRPWKNFAFNRNEALQLAKNEGDYLLFMDADDALTFEPDYVRPETFDLDAYYTKIFYSGTTYDRMQLVSTKPDWKWIGVVHEVIVCTDTIKIGYLDGVTMKIIGGGGRSQDPNKFLKDIKVLEEDLLTDPTNARSMFYLAQSYRDAGLLEEAITHYQKRVEMGGWDEEVFWALYQIGVIQERLQYPDDVVLASYYKAYDYRPTRIEPLYRIAVVHKKLRQPYHALLILNSALRVPKPRDLIFVESWVYDFGLLFEYSVCAFATGLYQEAFNASLKLLSSSNTPDDVRKTVDRNLQTIIQVMSSQSTAQSSPEMQEKAG